MATWAWILIAVVVVIIVALIVLLAMRQRRTAVLRQRFGAEYDRIVAARDGRRAAETDLRAREKQRAQLDIQPLPELARLRFAAEWRAVQERFVDLPSNAVMAADGLVYRVMAARGYPVDDFEAQATLISVDHPDLVENYRLAHTVCDRAKTQQASTEDLRGALLHYRSLLDELLDSASASGTGPAEGEPRHAADPQDDGRHPQEHTTERGTR